jgi:hypothetical protein
MFRGICIFTNLLWTCFKKVIVIPLHKDKNSPASFIQLIWQFYYTLNFLRCQHLLFEIKKHFNAFSFEKVAPKEKALQKEKGRYAGSRRLHRATFKKVDKIIALC